MSRWFLLAVRAGSLLLFLLAAAGVAAMALSYGWNRLNRLNADRRTSRHLIQSSGAAPPTAPLRVHPTNPRYFADGAGRAILLVGAHTWYTLVDSGFSDPPPAFDYTVFLDSLQARGHNFFRMFAWEQARWSVPYVGEYYFTPQAYERTGPGTALDGKAKFDLTRFNQAYFDRLRERVQAAGARGIYVAIQLFEGFSVEAKPSKAANNPWPGHPFNRANNINGTDGDPNGNGQGEETQTLLDPVVTALQDAYVRKVIDTVNDLDNVLYEICNEANANSEGWQYRLIDLIKSYEAGKPKQHPVGMTVEWPNGDNAELFASAADWISPNSWGGYWDNPPAADGRKVVINDTDHLCYPCGDTPFVWRSAMRGYNPAFMDAYDCRNDVESSCDPDDPAWVSLRRNLGYARILTSRMNLAAMTPRGELSSTGYCLANPVAVGAEYLVYLPAGQLVLTFLEGIGVRGRTPSLYLPPDSRVTLDLSAAREELHLAWLDLQNGWVTTGDRTSGGGRRTLTAPTTGDTVLYVYGASLFRQHDQIGW